MLLYINLIYSNVCVTAIGQIERFLYACPHKEMIVFGPCQYLGEKPLRFVEAIGLAGTRKMIRKSVLSI